MTDEKSREVRPALEVLARLRGGRVMLELSEEINTVVESVIKTRKKGSVSMTLTFQPIDNAQNGVVVKADVDGKPPELAKATDVFFADDDFNLHSNNPRQRDLWPRPEPAPVAVPAAATGSMGEQSQ